MTEARRKEILTKLSMTCNTKIGTSLCGSHFVVGRKAICGKQTDQVEYLFFENEKRIIFRKVFLIGIVQRQTALSYEM